MPGVANESGNTPWHLSKLEEMGDETLEYKKNVSYSLFHNENALLSSNENSIISAGGSVPPSLRRGAD